MKVISRGFLEICYEKNFVSINYGGNMGATIKKASVLFEELFGLGTFNKVRSMAYKEEGSPDYYWYMLVTNSNFEQGIK